MLLIINQIKAGEREARVNGNGLCVARFLAGDGGSWTIITAYGKQWFQTYEEATRSFWKDAVGFYRIDNSPIK